MVDIDDTIIEVHGYAKQGVGLRLLRGPRPQRAARHRLHRRQRAPVIVAQRLRKGSCGSPRGAKRLVADALKTAAARSASTGQAAGARRLGVLRPRRRSPPRCAAGADVSVTVRMDPKVKAAIATIGDDAWTTDRVHRRGLRRTDQTVDLPGRGRRDPVHRVHLAEEGRAGPRPAGGPPDPRPQPRQASHGQDDAVRHLALPRLLHHHRPRRVLTPWPRTRPTAGTRSSSRSTPT